jgi:pyruvate dehydrogenase E2 component (dihydrolipoamide acetyltransferase)
MIEFKMPSLGADMDEGTLQEWLVKPGDTVCRGQVVAVVDTTKAAVEVECWHDGTIQELLIPAGETVGVGTVLATLSDHEKASKATAQPAEKARRPKKRAPAGAPPPAERVPVRGPAHRRWVSPAARRLAEKLHVDTDSLSGGGPQGAVTIHDVEQAAASQHESQPAASTSDRAAAMRQSIAAAMSRSKREIPHYYLAEQILMERALSWLTERNANRPITERVLPAVLQLKACALAAKQFGEFNGFWKDGSFQSASGIHVGVAISLRGGGLVAPAIHDVAEKNLDELMSDLTDLVARARRGSLRSSEMSDPSITVTNLGDQGVDTVYGVIYPPQVALVGFGRPTQKVCAVDGGIRIATAVQATLAADHRASDGHRGALFLAAIGQLLQDPDTVEK